MVGMGRTQYAISAGDHQVRLFSESRGGERQRSDRDPARQPTSAPVRPAGTAAR